MYGSTTAVSEIIESQEALYRKAKDNPGEFELRSAEHASNIVEILKRNGYTPRGKKESEEYETMYQTIYAEAVTPRSIGGLTSALVNQTDAAIEYTTKIDTMRCELIQKIEADTKHLIEEAKTETPTFVRYAEAIEEYTRFIINDIKEYEGIKDDEEIKIIPATVKVKVDEETAKAMGEALMDSLRKIHNYTIMQIIGMEVNEDE